MTYPGFAAGALLCLLTSAALADPVQQSASLPLTLEHDSNPRMTARGGESVFRQRFAAQYVFSRGGGGASAVDLSLGAVLERSNNEAVSANRADPSLGLTWRRASDTAELAVSGRFEQASARAAEFQQSGLIAGDATRKTQSVGISWRNALSERTSLTLGGDYRDVSYRGNRDGDGLVNFTTTGLKSELGYMLSERGEIFSSLAGSRYEPANNSSATVASSKNYNLMLGYREKLSETLDFSIQGGKGRIENASSTDSSWQGNGRLNYTGERLEAAFDIGRSVIASGVTGGFANSDQVKLQLSYLLSERTRTGIELSRIENKGSAPNTAHAYAAWVNYEISSFWSVMLRGYRKEVEGLAYNASANIFGLTLVYSHPDF